MLESFGYLLVFILSYDIRRFFSACHRFHSFQDHGVSAAERGAGDAADVAAEQQLSACFFGNLKKRIVGFYRFAIDSIQSGACNAAGLQSSNQCFAVHQLTAGCIDQIRRILHFFEKRCVRHIARLIVDRCVQADNITDC